MPRHPGDADYLFYVACSYLALPGADPAPAHELKMPQGKAYYNHCLIYPYWIPAEALAACSKAGWVPAGG